MMRVKNYKRLGFIGIILTALGVIFSTTMKESVGSIGTVFIAVGALFLIIAMSAKRHDN